MNKDLIKVQVFWHNLWGVKVHPQEDFELMAKAVTCENKIGKFDILPGHANIVSAIFNNMTVFTDKENKEVIFEKGIVEASANEAKFFLELKREAATPARP